MSKPLISNKDNTRQVYAKDNNLFVVDLITMKEIQLTADGSDVVYNSKGQHGDLEKTRYPKS